MPDEAFDLFSTAYVMLPAEPEQRVADVRQLAAAARMGDVPREQLPESGWFVGGSRADFEKRYGFRTIWVDEAASFFKGLFDHKPWSWDPIWEPIWRAKPSDPWEWSPREVPKLLDWPEPPRSKALPIPQGWKPEAKAKPELVPKAQLPEWVKRNEKWRD